MFNGKKVVLITPAGRPESMDILSAWIMCQETPIDEWRIWYNPRDKRSSDYLDVLIAKNPRFIKKVTKTDKNLGMFWFEDNCCQQNTLYLRMDDDIVFAPSRSINALLAASDAATPDTLLVGGNVVNNAVCTHLQQQAGLFPLERGKVDKKCMDKLGWENPQFAEFVHRNFLALAESGDEFKLDFGIHELKPALRFSINCMSWKGENMQNANIHEAKNKHILIHDEEEAIAAVIPTKAKMKHVIVGSAVFSHLSFYTQRKHIGETDITEKYLDLMIKRLGLQ